MSNACPDFPQAASEVGVFNAMRRRIKEITSKMKFKGKSATRTRVYDNNENDNLHLENIRNVYFCGLNPNFP